MTFQLFTLTERMLKVASYAHIKLPRNLTIFL